MRQSRGWLGLLGAVFVGQVCGPLPLVAAQPAAAPVRATQPAAATQPPKLDAGPQAGVPGDEYARVVQAAVEAYNRDDFVNARKYFARAHELRPSARTWRGLGTTAFELKFYEDAVRELTFALEDQRSALPPHLRDETELTLRVARRTLAERTESAAAGTSGSKATRDAEPPAPPVLKPSLAATVEQEPPESGLGGQRIAALIVAGAGLVSVAVGIGFGVRSIAKGDDRDRLCPDASMGCSSAAVRAADDALTAGDISTVAWVVGGVALAGGAALWFTGAPAERQPSAAGARVSLGLGSLRVAGKF